MIGPKAIWMIVTAGTDGGPTPEKTASCKKWPTEGVPTSPGATPLTEKAWSWNTPGVPICMLMKPVKSISLSIFSAVGVPIWPGAIPSTVNSCSVLHTVGSPTCVKRISNNRIQSRDM